MRLSFVLSCVLALAVLGLFLWRRSVRPAGDEAQVEPPLALRFRISSVQRGVKPIPSAPFFAPGGDWLFFEAVPEGSPEARLTVGVNQGSPKQGMAWGKAVIAVDSPKAGGAFVAAFARAFGVRPPDPHAGGPLEPLELPTAVLGEQLRSLVGGGFSSEGGTWTATKWFPSLARRQGEVYFNYDLQNLVGEFTEKDADYSEDLVAVFAMALRDGRPLPRTPANDPSLSEVGPTFERVRQVGGPRARMVGLAPNPDAFLLAESDPAGGELVLEVAIEREELLRIARVDGHVEEVQHVPPPASGFVVRESRPQEQGVHSSEDPAWLWWVAAPGAEPVRIDGSGFGLRPGLADAAPSPDGRFLAVVVWEDSAPGRLRRRRTLFYDRSRHTVIEAQGTAKSYQVEGWELAGPSWKACAVSGFGWDPPESREHVRIDPLSGALEQAAAPKMESALSPDGKHRWSLEEGALVVTEVPTGSRRSLPLHPDDAAAIGEASEFDPALHWVSPRYLSLSSTPLVLFDAVTLRASIPFPGDVEPSVDFNRSFTAALLGHEEGTFIARVRLPAWP